MTRLLIPAFTEEKLLYPDLAEPVPSRVRAVVQKAGQPDAACTTKSPDGRPCVARVQRYYMRQKQKG